MGIRPEVEEMLKLGPLPSTTEGELAEIDDDWLELFQALLESVPRPVSVDEATALTTLFGPDECMGFAWTLLHLIETAPESPLTDEPPPGAPEMLHILWARQRNRR